jgi:hypothetical protein
MATVIMQASGVNGQLEVQEDRICIKRKGIMGFLTQGHRGEKEILLSSISAIQFKQAGLLTNGFIQFSFIGGQETKGGLFDATKDENSIMFNKGQAKQFEAAKLEIEQRMSAMRTGATAPAHASLADELEKLAALRDRGILTEDEFQAKKRQLLNA